VKAFILILFVLALGGCMSPKAPPIIIDGFNNKVVVIIITDKTVSTDAEASMPALGL